MHMLWLLYTFGSLTSRACGSIAHKMLARDVRVSGETLGFLFLSSSLLLTLVSIPIFGLTVDTSFTTLQWAALVGMAATQGVGMIFYFRALQQLSSTAGQIIFSSILVFSAVLGSVFLGTHFSALNIVGIVVLISAIALVSRRDLRANLSGTMLMLTAALFFAGYQILSVAVVHEISLVTYLLSTYLGAAVCIFAYAPRQVYTEITAYADKTRLCYLASIAGVTSFGNVALAYLAYASAPVPIKVALLLTAQVVVTVILAYIFLREREDFSMRLIAVALVVVAGYLILL
jgi:drug/metabolite transporter (DMT)-like permease